MDHSRETPSTPALPAKRPAEDGATELSTMPRLPPPYIEDERSDHGADNQSLARCREEVEQMFASRPATEFPPPPTRAHCRTSYQLPVLNASARPTTDSARDAASTVAPPRPALSLRRTSPIRRNVFVQEEWSLASYDPELGWNSRSQRSFMVRSIQDRKQRRTRMVAIIFIVLILGAGVVFGVVHGYSSK